MSYRRPTGRYGPRNMPRQYEPAPSYDTYDKPPPRPGPNQGKGRRRKEHQKQRADNFKDKKGNEFQNAQKELIKKDLLVGTTEEDALAKLNEYQTLRAITLFVTSRGVGLGLCHLVNVATNYTQDRIVIPDIYAMYRVYLGAFEMKVETVIKSYPAIPRIDDVYRSNLSADSVKALKTITYLPTPMRQIINLIGVLKLEDRVYVPAIAPNIVDRNERFVPRPETVVLTNLRQVVEALANPETPAALQNTI